MVLLGVLLMWRVLVVVVVALLPIVPDYLVQAHLGYVGRRGLPTYIHATVVRHTLVDLIGRCTYGLTVL